MGDRKKIIIATIVLVMFIVGVAIYSLGEKPLKDEFRGTFVAKDGVEQLWFAVSLQDNTFYYTDQFNGYYIRGSFEDIGDGMYSIQCDDEANRTIIPLQTVQYADYSFSLESNGENNVFVKSGDTPGVVRNKTEYK